MILYADASGLAKRYVLEVGTDRAIAWLGGADLVVTCRIAFVEVSRAIALAERPFSDDAQRAFERDWEELSIVEVDAELARKAADLAVGLRLRSLDALHLAAADLLRPEDLRVMAFDRRLWRAARAWGLPVLPEDEP